MHILLHILLRWKQEMSIEQKEINEKQQLIKDYYLI